MYLPMTLTLANVTLDCADAGRLGAFWAAALGRPLDEELSEAFASIGRGSAERPIWLFLQVPEGKSAKNRMHVDLEADDRALEVERLLGLGATQVTEKDEWGVQWSVLLDPEGNEFCVAGPH